MSVFQYSFALYPDDYQPSGIISYFIIHIIAMGLLLFTERSEGPWMHGLVESTDSHEFFHE